MRRRWTNEGISNPRASSHSHLVTDNHDDKSSGAKLFLLFVGRQKREEKPNDGRTDGRAIPQLIQSQSHRPPPPILFSFSPDRVHLQSRRRTLPPPPTPSPPPREGKECRRRSPDPAPRRPPCRRLHARSGWRRCLGNPDSSPLARPLSPASPSRRRTLAASASELARRRSSLPLLHQLPPSTLGRKRRHRAARRREPDGGRRRTLASRIGVNPIHHHHPTLRWASSRSHSGSAISFSLPVLSALSVCRCDLRAFQWHGRHRYQTSSIPSSC